MRLDVAIFKNTMSLDGYYIADAIYEGIRKFDACRISELKYEPCDVAVIAGGLKYKTTDNGLEVAGSTARWRKPIMDKHPVNRINIESALFRRNYVEKPPYRRIAWGLGYMYDDGNFMNWNSPPDRWEKISKQQNIDVKPWRKTGDHILLILQKENDSSLRGIDIIAWAEKTIKEIRKYTDRPIIIRPHPLNKRSYPEMPGTTLSTHPLLQGDLKNAWAVVSYTSLSCVEAICEGIPTFTSATGNMAWPVCNHQLNQIEDPKMFDRSQWLYDTAYAQWSLDELKDGTAWKRLRDGFDKIQSKEESSELHKDFGGGRKKKK